MREITAMDCGSRLVVKLGGRVWLRLFRSVGFGVLSAVVVVEDGGVIPAEGGGVVVVVDEGSVVADETGDNVLPRPP